MGREETIGESSVDTRYSGQVWLALAAACCLATAVLHPILQAGFFGDDYDLWHFGRQLIADPSLALIGISNFYRPANSWLFAAHHLLFGAEPFPYHVVTLLMHLGCGVLLGLLLRRFGTSAAAIFVASSFWLCSPYTFEPVMFVNASYNDLTVLLVWLGLAVLWPGPEMPWSGRRLLLASLLITFSLFCKESWVIIAALAPAYQLAISRSSTSRALRCGLLLAIPVATYIVIYLLVFSGREGYYLLGSHVVTKIPHLWACFSWLGTLQAHLPSFGLSELAGVVLLLACSAVGWQRRSRLIGLGLVLFLVPLLPVLPVAWIPTRYTTVPLIGFVLVMAGVAREVVASCPARRKLAKAGFGLVAVTALAVNLVWMRGELADMRRLRQVHQALLDQARLFAPQIPVDRPLVCLRLRDDQPLRRLHAEGHAGLPKPVFVRADCPDGLISWAALLTYVRTGLGDELLVDSRPQPGLSQPYAMIGHSADGFHPVTPRATTLWDEVEAWEEAGVFVRVVAPQLPGDLRR